MDRENANKDAVLKAVNGALLEYNDEIKNNGLAVRAFSLRWDDDFENWVVTTIFVVDDISRAEDMSFVDKYCSASGDALSEHCAFTYCTFRSEDEYKEEFSNLSWVSELVELKNAA